MAKLIFTEEDERLTASLLEEFDPVKALSGTRLRDLVSAGDWDTLMENERSIMTQQMRAAQVVAALQLRRGHFDVITTILDDGSMIERDLSQAQQAIAIQDQNHLSWDTVEEFENIAGANIDAAVRRVMNLEPVS